MAPFLIQDETPRTERVPRQMNHQNEVTGIGRVTVAVDQVATVQRWYADVIGDGGHEVQRVELDAGGVRVRIGVHEFDFVEPRRPRSPLVRWLEARGSSPYAATLRTSSGIARVLDQTDTLGARLSLT